MATLAIGHAAQGISWSRLLTLAGAAQIVGLAVAALVLRDNEAAAIGVATLIGLGLLRFRGGTLGVVILGLVFLDTAFFTGAAAVTNFLDRAAPAATIGPGVLAVIALVGLVASVARVARRSQALTSSRSATNLAFLAVAALLVIGAVAIVTGGRVRSSGADVLRLEVSGARYSQAAMSATSGTVTVEVTNHDLFWHTFTIAELGVDLKLPVGGAQQVTFTAAPGTYTYICSVPGHAAFMHGTLTVP